MKSTPGPAAQRVGIVGPCTAGKSTLIANIAHHFSDVELRHIAQEHSYVLTMWQQISKPRWLIFLDVSYQVTLQRKNLRWSETEYQEQLRRLSNARANADFYLLTDHLTPEEVASKVSAFLEQIGFRPSNKSG